MASKQGVTVLYVTAFLCCGSSVQWVMIFYMADVNKFLLVN